MATETTSSDLPSLPEAISPVAPPTGGPNVGITITWPKGGGSDSTGGGSGGGSGGGGGGTSALPTGSGLGALLYWNGSSWQSFSPPTGSDLYVLGCTNGALEWIETEGCGSSISGGTGGSTTPVLVIGAVSSVAPNSKEVRAESTSYSIRVSGVNNWEIYVPVSWVTVSVVNDDGFVYQPAKNTTGSGNATVIITIATNTTNRTREATVWIGALAHTITQAYA